MNTRPTSNRLWKILFFLLLTLNLAFIGVITYRLIAPSSSLPAVSQVENNQAAQLGRFTTTREQLNTSLDRFLHDYQTKDLSYDFYATEQELLFQGQYQLLGQSLPLTVAFTPNVLTDGNIQLDISRVVAGTLSLPKEIILAYVASSYQLPEFINIDAKKAQVRIALTQLETDQGLYFQAKELDLAQDRLVFDLYKR